jgi:hypothetical protein
MGPCDHEKIIVAPANDSIVPVNPLFFQDDKRIAVFSFE